MPFWSTNTAFDETGVQFAWDSTSLGAFKTCPRKYQLSIRQGLRPPELSVDLSWGLLIHKASEFYHTSRAEGQSHEGAVHDALQQLWAISWRPELTVDPDPRKNRFTLLRAAVWYFDHFQHDGLKTVVLANGKPATELSFRLELPARTRSGLPFLVCGHIDRLVEDMYGNLVADIKSTKNTLSPRFFAQFNPHNQMSLYTVANRILWGTESQGVLIDGVQCAVGFNRFQRQVTLRSKEVLEEWVEDAIWWMRQAEALALEREEEPWPQQDTACANYRGCSFASRICTERPRLRAGQMRLGFRQEMWDPLRSREQEN